MAKKQQSPCANYVFTWNNYTDDCDEKLREFSKGCRGVIYGREVAPSTGTPHLQGYFQLINKMRITQLVKLLPGVHFQVAKGDELSNEKYCSKDGKYVKLGEFEKVGGSLVTIRMKINECETWSDVLDIKGIERHLNYARECWANRKVKKVEGVVLRGWQQQIVDIVQQPADDRIIYWVHDSEGAKGKTFLAKYLVSNYGAFYCSPGRSADIAYAYDNQGVFLYDVPRSCDDTYLNFGLLEKVKDGIYFSGKYCPITKVRKGNAHVIVFSNGYCPDGTFSDDRIRLIELDRKSQESVFCSIVSSDVQYCCNVKMPVEEERAQRATEAPSGGPAPEGRGGQSRRRTPGGRATSPPQPCQGLGATPARGEPQNFMADDFVLVIDD